MNFTSATEETIRKSLLKLNKRVEEKKFMS